MPTPAEGRGTSGDHEGSENAVEVAREDDHGDDVIRL